MRKEEDYMDQLFKDHFEDFAKSPGEGVWEGVVANGNMANGKRLGYSPYGKYGLLLGLGLLLTFGILQGYQTPVSNEKIEHLAIEEVAQGEVFGNSGLPQSSQASLNADGEPEPVESAIALTQNERESTATGNAAPVVTEKQYEESARETTVLAKPMDEVSAKTQPAATISDDNQMLSVTTGSVANLNISGSGAAPEADYLLGINLLGLDHISKDPNKASWVSFNDPLTVKNRRDLARSWMMKAQGDAKVKGGHWFVSGAFVADASIESDRKFILGLDGLAFGAGKYLSPDSFIEVSLRGAWSNGFNMRATYARLFLPGRLRPYVQGGLAWGESLNLRAGLGLMYTPQNLDKWRFYVSANYEGGFSFSEQNSGEAGVFEIGAQIRLSGTERVLSDNNWMNSIPLYELPRGWYADASASFSFDEKTKVVDYSAYIGKYLKRRLFIRGGLRVDRDDVAIPVQVQYHFLVRKQLRFGAYTGASLEIQNTRLGAELGFIAYYEVMPGLSLFVAPVLLEGSTYNERLFETGIQLYLSKKK
ncbi:MAG: hypothetical protein Roseis2KO_02820 [Roseivirga sp.]